MSYEPYHDRLAAREPSPSVLLVDDRPENLLALEAVLEPLNVDLVRAGSAAEALRCVDEREFAVILLDVQMPGTDGHEAARLIKTRERSRVTPILFVTALDRDRRRMTTGYQAGAVDYLFKPLDPDELRAKVAAFVELHRVHEEERDRRRRYADRLVYSSEERYLLAAIEAEQARDAAEAADRAKSEFLARMSHELRTPLNAILGYVQLLDLGIDGPMSPPQHTQLNRVRLSAVHLLSLVNDILDYATLDTASPTLAYEVGQIRDACEAALPLVRIEAAGRSLTFSETVGQGPTYVGDADRVRQVLVHLLTNAVKFTMPGGQISVTCGTTAAPDAGAALPGAGPWAFVRVTDTGVGIPAAELETIFVPFEQGDGGRTRTEGGTGLGLTISRRLARLMDGDITVQSEVGEGSTFTIWLPTPDATDAPPPLALPASATALAVDFLTAGKAQQATARSDAEDAMFARVSALGAALFARIPDVCMRHTDRLRSDPTLPNVAVVSGSQLLDHVSTVLGELAHILATVGEMGGRAPELLRDGSEILRLTAELHGAQRRRLGWQETHFARELEILCGEVDAALEAAAAEMRPDDPAVGDALRYATALTHRVLERSRQTNLRGFRRLDAAYSA
jgi:signal transduction histidine kinase